MTEPKSPREIAEAICEDWFGPGTAPRMSDTSLADDIESALLSYAAERERLLADADWLIDNIVTQLREMYVASPIGPVTDAAIERHRARSRPATEGKGDD